MKAVLAALDFCRYWLTPAFIRRHLRDRGY